MALVVQLKVSQEGSTNKRPMLLSAFFKVHARERPVNGEVERGHMNLGEIYVDFMRTKGTGDPTPINEGKSKGCGK